MIGRRALPGLIAVSLLAAGTGRLASAQPGGAPAIDPDDIGGTVTSAAGGEAGGWGLAEAGDLGTESRQTVVNDDPRQVRLPDLPPATYSVWVRGYGLVDSPPVRAEPGAIVDLDAVVAPDARAAAAIYPANYWYSLMEIPEPAQFPGTGPDGNKIAPGMTSQHD